MVIKGGKSLRLSVCRRPVRKVSLRGGGSAAAIELATVGARASLRVATCCGTR